MSIKIMTQAWQTELRYTEKLVLLSLADNANDEGNCHPSITTIMRKCGMTDRGVQKILQRLIGLGHISCQQRSGRSSIFTIHPCISTPERHSPRTAFTPNTVHPSPEHGSPPPPNATTDTPEHGSPRIFKRPSREEEDSEKIDTSTGPVERVFEHWRLEFNHQRAALDGKRRRVIAAALESYDEATVIASISGYKHSAHHMGQNEHRTVYDDIALFLRDATHIDAGLRFARGPPRQLSPVERVKARLNGNGNERVVSEQSGSGEPSLGTAGRMLRRVPDS